MLKSGRDIQDEENTEIRSSWIFLCAIEDILSNGFESLDDAKINDVVANIIEEPKNVEIDAIKQTEEPRKA